MPVSASLESFIVNGKSVKRSSFARFGSGSRRRFLRTSRIARGGWGGLSKVAHALSLERRPDIGVYDRRIFEEAARPRRTAADQVDAAFLGRRRTAVEATHPAQGRQQAVLEEHELFTAEFGQNRCQESCVGRDLSWPTA